MNRKIKVLSKPLVGIKAKRPDSRKSEFKDLCGVWFAKDLREFENATRSFEEIDKEKWKYNH